MRKKILIAARTERACDMYKEMLDENRFEVTTATDAASVRLLDIGAYTTAFISLPLADESGVKLIEELHESAEIPVGVMVRSDLPDKAVNKLLESNAYILRKPVPRAVFSTAAELLTSFFLSSSEMRAKISELEHKNSEIKLMSRAKLLLIETKGMSEDDSHKYILRQAMNNQMNIEDVCRKIISGSG